MQLGGSLKTLACSEVLPLIASLSHTYIHKRHSRQNTSRRRPAPLERPAIRTLSAPFSSSLRPLRAHFQTTTQDCHPNPSTMAHTSRFYVKPVSQAFAEKATTDGLCGDVLHTEKCAITQCTLSKSMAVRTANASYCIIHANSVPGTVMGRQPRRLAPTSQSREFLSEARRQFYGVGAATAGVDYAASTSHRESKVGRLSTWDAYRI